jgi:hypothetical protein
MRFLGIGVGRKRGRITVCHNRDNVTGPVRGVERRMLGSRR